MKRLKLSQFVVVLCVVCAAFSLANGQSATNEPSKTAEAVQKANISKKPQPKYTKEAKRLQITGTVILRCIFRSSGKITDITVIQGLPNGLTERAIEAAKKIKFTPAMKDGYPVSMWMQLEYNFNLY